MKYVIWRMMRGLLARFTASSTRTRSTATRCAWALVIALGGTGCAKRIDFTPTELEEVQVKAGVDPLRVYVNKTMVALYPRDRGQQQFNVHGSIRASSRKDLRIVETTRRTMGQIVEISERNGQPLLWVTFDRACRAPECAYGFVQTEDKRFRLLEVPNAAGYGTPTVYYRRERDKLRMQKGKLASLAEANEVYLLKKKNGDILTIDLQVIKEVRDEGTKVRSRNRGVDLP